MSTKQILYVSALASEKKINIEYNLSGKNPGFAVQKFSRLLVRGLQANGIKVQVLSSSTDLSGTKRFAKTAREMEYGVYYKYVPFLNVPIIKHLCLFFYVFFYVLLWGINGKENKALICDVLSISICMGALLASKLNKVQSIAMVTDIYGMMVGKDNGTLKFKLSARLNFRYTNCFNKYILVTEQMNEVVNLKGRPYIVMEAICDSSLLQNACNYTHKVQPRTIMYAGGIFEEYGLKMLAEGFLKANVPDTKLVYYGEGTYVAEFMALCEKNPNIEYKGMALNDTIVEEEHKATLLVNPRFTKGKFTSYSFPSKNMEYMVSGTPLLTTKLAGIPKEYFPYVLFFEDESVERYAGAIKSALARSETELYELGGSAKRFVLMKKNNIEQGRRICEFLFE